MPSLSRCRFGSEQEAGAQAQFLEFIREFRVDNNFIYRSVRLAPSSPHPHPASTSF